MVERAAEETSEPEDAAFAHGSLGHPKETAEQFRARVVGACRG